MLFEKMTEVLDPEPHGAALNMAIDEALLRTASEPLLRIYRWARPAISFGYFEKIAALDALPSGWEMVRRWTGGGVVVHGEDLTYTLIVSADHPFARLPASESYRQIHGCIGKVFRTLGVETSLASATTPKTSSSCFENPADADVLADDRKIAGAAQRRTRWGLLHQGSIQRIPISDGLAARLAQAFAGRVIRRQLSVDESSLAKTLAAEKYAAESWLRRF
jgi:lipoate-protein ligase A